MAAFSSKGNELSGFCSFALTRGQSMYQHVYKCESCQILFCEGCLSCHNDCMTEYLEMKGATCECGLGAGRGDCQCVLMSVRRVEEFCVGDEESAASFIQAYDTARDYNYPGPLGDQAIRLHSIEYQSVEEIARDCHELASLSKETFYIDAHAAPRCRLEAVAQQILHYHMSQLGSLSRCKTVGAEFWCQVKDSLNGDNISSGVDIHYDKDEFLSDKLEIGVFPAISTVTYLAAPQGSAATIILGNKIDDPVGGGIRECLLSYPQINKHVSFDGRFLHGAPAALNEPIFGRSRGLSASTTCKGLEESESAKTAQKRVTFLVNVWVDHRPLEAAPLSERQVAALNEIGQWQGDMPLVSLAPVDFAEATTSLSVAEAQCTSVVDDSSAAKKGGIDKDIASGGDDNDVVMIRIPFLGSEDEVAWGYEKKEASDAEHQSDHPGPASNHRGELNTHDIKDGKMEYDSINEKEEEEEKEKEGDDDDDEDEEELGVFMWLPVTDILSRLPLCEDDRHSGRLADTTFVLAYESDRIAPKLA